jgi:hypothetical protein
MLRPPTPPQLILIRGLPGSGKSTLAANYRERGYRHLEADQFFLVDGEYRFDPEQLGEAHAWCLDQARQALAAGELVCVANTFVTPDEIKPYTQLVPDWHVVEVAHDGRSIHAVPEDTLQSMQAKWVPTDEVVAVLKRPPLQVLATPSVDAGLPDLTFPMVRYARNETPWDLRVLLYKGASEVGYRGGKAFIAIAEGQYGQPVAERLPLVTRIHAEMTARLVAGGKGARTTARNTFDKLRAFVIWADQNDQPLSLETVETTYRHWTDFLVDRWRVKGEIKEESAISIAQLVSSIIGAALERTQPLHQTTRLAHGRKRGARAVGVQADKQNLAHTFAFGHLLVDVIDSLPLEAIYGPLPAMIRTRDGRCVEQWSGMQDPQTAACLQPGYRRKHNTRVVLAHRAAWEAEHTPRTRFPLINLRIAAELMLFIGQTAMNLSQAADLKITQYSYESTIDGYKVYDYKERAQKEVLFEIFTDYKAVFEDYLTLRKKLVGNLTDKLFPFVQPFGGADHSELNTRLLKKLCQELGIPWIPASTLRKTRINWLLRESRDPDLTAEKAQHLKQTLVRDYEKPSLQVAMREIIQFYRKTDPRLGGSMMPCPAVGICDGVPEPLPDLPAETPKPDCTHPAGCLFCGHHRDIDSEDYVWSMASMRFLNTLLLRRFGPTEKGKADRAAHVEMVLQVLTQKLKWFEDSNTKRQAWVSEALEKLAEGDFHLHWRYLIESAEGV